MIRITTTKAKKGITPQEFYKEICQSSLEDYVSVINAPTADKPYGQSYTVEMLGNVVGSRAVRYINVPMERLKELAIAQMQQVRLFGLVQMSVSSANRKAGIPCDRCL